MSVPRMIEIGMTTAKAAIETAAGSGDSDAATLRVGILEFLRMHAVQFDGGSDHVELLEAYRDWLETAATLYRTADESTVREYVRRGALLGAELDLENARAAGPLVSVPAADGSPA